MSMYIDANGNKHIAKKHPDDCKCGCLAHREKIMARKLRSTTKPIAELVEPPKGKE